MKSVSARGLDTTFTIAEIKAAFWKEFHQRGELWFPYPTEGEPSDIGENTTRLAFMDFLEHLFGQWPSDEELRVILPEKTEEGT